MNLRSKNFYKSVVPTICASVISGLYVVVDGIFVGRGVGTDGLGAVNISMPLVLFIMAVTMMLSMGGGTLTSIALGRGDNEKANNIFKMTLSATILICCDNYHYLSFNARAGSLSKFTLPNIIRSKLPMKIGIIVDSCCDLSSEMLIKIQADIVPLKITVGNQQFIDDNTIDIVKLLQSIKSCKEAPSTACPSITEFADAMKKYEQCFVITLSSKLSGTYNAAIVAKELVLEDYPTKKIHVIDSLGASSTEVLLALYLKDCSNSDYSFEEMISLVEARKKACRTLFVLDDLSTLMKNGRLGKVAGSVATILSVRLIMNGNSKGEIELLEKIRGTKKTLRRMVSIIENDTKKDENKSIRVVLAQCNCRDRAEYLKENILETCQAVSEVLIVNTRGLSSVYANDGGIIVSYYTYR